MSLKEGVSNSVKCFPEMVLGRGWEEVMGFSSQEASDDMGPRSKRHKSQMAVSSEWGKIRRGTKMEGKDSSGQWTMWKCRNGWERGWSWTSQPIYPSNRGGRWWWAFVLEKVWQAFWGLFHLDCAQKGSLRNFRPESAEGGHTLDPQFPRNGNLKSLSSLDAQQPEWPLLAQGGPLANTHWLVTEWLNESMDG